MLTSTCLAAGRRPPALLKSSPDWSAPILWRSEFRNILAGFTRRETLTLEQAAGLQREAEGLLDGCEYQVDSLAVLKLVSGSDCSAYDCEFIALARQLETKLITADKQLLRAFPADAVRLVAT